MVDGKSAVDESMVTGESMPAPKTPGDKLIGGTVNGNGSLVMRADKIGAGTVLSRIVAMVSRGAAQPSADPAHGRHCRRLLRSGCAWHRRRRLYGVGRSGVPHPRSPSP